MTETVLAVEEPTYVVDQYCNQPQGEFDWEQAVSVFTVADADEQKSLWDQADTALQVRNIFGRLHRQARREALRRFAGEVRRSTTTLAKYARTAEYFPKHCIPEEDYVGRHWDVPFSLYRIAANHCTDGRSARAAMQEALENDWKCTELQKELVKRNRSKLTGVLESEGDVLYLDDQPLPAYEDVARFLGLRVRLKIEIVDEEDE